MLSAPRERIVGDPEVELTSGYLEGNGDRPRVWFLMGGRPEGVDGEEGVGDGDAEGAESDAHQGFVEVFGSLVSSKIAMPAEKASGRAAVGIARAAMSCRTAEK